jgi:hypothetical protein
MSNLLWGAIGILVLIIIIVVVIFILTSSSSSTDAISEGCTQCLTSGFYSCPAGVITSTGTDAWSGLAGRVSTYRLPEYDPVDPNVNIGGTKYYWRDGVTTGCGTY